MADSCIPEWQEHDKKMFYACCISCRYSLNTSHQPLSEAVVGVDKASLFCQFFCRSAPRLFDKLLILAAVYVLYYVGMLSQRCPHHGLCQPTHLSQRSGNKTGQVELSLLPRNCWPKKAGTHGSTHSGDMGEVHSEQECERKFLSCYGFLQKKNIHSTIHNY